MRSCRSRASRLPLLLRLWRSTCCIHNKVQTRQCALDRRVHRIQHGSSSAIKEASNDSTSPSPSAFSVEIFPALKVLAESFRLMKQSPAFQNWTSADWLLGLTVMAQHNTSQRKKKNPGESTEPLTSTTHVNKEMLCDLLRYVRLCDAVYADSDERFCLEGQVSPDSIVSSSPGRVFSPKYIVVLDHTTHEIIVVVRGSATILDFCTDLCLVNEPFQDGQGHRGMVHAANWLVQDVRKVLDQLSQEFPDYHLVTTGHSLGAGVAVLSSMLLRPFFPSAHCVAFATPASVTLDLAISCQSFVTSVIHGDDCVPRLHEHSLLRLQQQVSQFDWRSALKQLVVEEVDEQATVVKQKSEKQLQLIVNTMGENVSKIRSSTVVKRVTASIDRTKAVWSGYKREDVTDSLVDRLQVVKRVLQRHQEDGLGGDKWLAALEASVQRLETLVAVQKKEKKQDEAIDVVRPFTRLTSVTNRITNVVDETTQRVTESVKDATGIVQERMATWKSDVVDETTQRVTASVKDATGIVQERMAIWKSAVITTRPTTPEKAAEAQVEEAIRAHAETLMNTEDMQKLLSEFNMNEPTIDAKHEEDDARPTPLHAPLFPPGRILYLRGEDHNKRITLDAVDNDEFSCVVLSNNMIVDHLCTSYERALRQVNASQAK